MFSQEAFKTPKLQQPQSPAAAQTQLSHSSALSPFAPRVPRSSAAALSEQRARTQAQAQEPPADNRLAARSHRLRSPGELPTELRAALRQRDLQPARLQEPCSFAAGAQGVAWMALGGALYVWKTDAPQACMRLASGLAGETAHASLACIVQPAAGEPLLLLVCWRSRLALYPLTHVLRPRELLLAAPAPLATCALPAGTTVQPRTLQSVPPPPAASGPSSSSSEACALLASSAALGFAVHASKGGASLTLAPLARGGGTLHSLFSGVMGLLSQSSRPAAGPIMATAYSHGPDGGVVVCLTGGAGAAEGHETLEIFRRQGGPAGPWALAAEHALPPLLAPCVQQMGGQLGATLRLADVCAAPAAEGHGGVVVWLLVGSQPAGGGEDAPCDLSVVGVLLAADDGAAPSVRPWAAGDLLRGALPASALGGARLAAGAGADGPLVLYSSAQAWALRDASGLPARTLLLAGGAGGAGGAATAAAAAAEAPLLGGLGEQGVLGGGGDAHGVLLLLSQRLVRLGYAEPAPAARGAARGARRTLDAAELAQVEATLLEHWRESAAAAAQLGAALSSPQPLPELLAVARDEASEQVARVVVAVGEGLVSERLPAGGALLEPPLRQRLAAHASLSSFCVAHHALLAPVRQPQRFAELLEAGERAAAALAVCQLRNGASAASTPLLLAALEGAAGQAADGEGQAAFYALLLAPAAGGGASGGAAFEALLVQLSALAAGTERLGALCALCDAAVLPLRAAREYRQEQMRLASAADGRRAAGAAAAAAAETSEAEAAAQRAGLVPWTATSVVLELLLRLATAVGQQALRGAQGDAAERDGAAEAALAQAVAMLHEARLHGLAARLAVARASARDAPAARAELASARQAAAAQLRALGALPQLLRLAETYCDFRTLAELCTQPPAPPTASGALPPPAGLQAQMLRTFEEPGLATTAALAAEEAEATGSFGAELLQALFEQGPLGCRELLRIGERYPYLRPTLSTFLQKHPGLHWMQLVGEEQFDHAARALYSWALQGEGLAFAGSVADRKAVLALGRLCHRAAMLPDAGPPPAELPPVARVSVPIDGRAAEEPMGEVRLRDASDEHYCLRVQERLPWLQLADGAACGTEAAVEKLLAHAAAAAPPAERGVSTLEALTLALDLVHKTAWRHTAARQGARLQAVLGTALTLGDELARWRSLGARNAGLTDTERRAELGSLALFCLLKYQEEKLAADPQRAAALHMARFAEGEGGVLAAMLHEAGCAADAKLRAALLGAQQVAAQQVAEAAAEGEDAAWVLVPAAQADDAMQE